ncbi:hypothetical protein [Sandaracinus amylolyticus]|uniref:Uncharacterized protein n=1 Tax=Sandaracinus amylolyticus TaxID=927083 RepID=A0A0F6W737_9BACT|nr:hypothetical protein [Sandaracinus amylolyticus]AKF08965.1 hypothetical protein DB32_006114 [Sandaracinus amylolyticus]
MRDALALVFSLTVTAILALAVWRRLRGPLTRVGLRAEPDRPRSFGYKSTWLALRSDDPREVVSVLRATDPRFRDATPCNWEHGFARVFGAPMSRDAFVTPSVAGWVFVVGYTPQAHPATSTRGDAQAALRALEQLSTSLARPLWYFGSHRGVDYVDWVAVEDGRTKRAYGHSDGTTLYDVGAPTRDEQELGLVFHDAARNAPDDEQDALSERLPNERTVVELASRWTWTPLELDACEEPSSGVLVRLR